MLTLKQVSELTQISPRALRRYIANGRLKVVRFSHRCVRVQADEFERFCQQVVSASELVSTSRQSI